MSLELSRYSADSITRALDQHGVRHYPSGMTAPGICVESGAVSDGYLDLRTRREQAIYCAGLADKGRKTDVELQRVTERAERMMADRDRMTMAFLDQLRVRGLLIEPNQDTLCPSCFNGHCELHDQVDDGRCRCPNCVEPEAVTA